MIVVSKKKKKEQTNKQINKLRRTKPRGMGAILNSIDPIPWCPRERSGAKVVLNLYQCSSKCGKENNPSPAINRSLPTPLQPTSQTGRQTDGQTDKLTMINTVSAVQCSTERRLKRAHFLG